MRSSPVVSSAIRPVSGALAVRGCCLSFTASPPCRQQLANCLTMRAYRGGTRAAVALRPVLSELGCLPVSAMIHVPNASKMFSIDGTLTDPSVQERWDNYGARSWGQLEWWRSAAKRHRESVDPTVDSPPFVAEPAERDAPTKSS